MRYVPRLLETLGLVLELPMAAADQSHLILTYNMRVAAGALW